MFDVKNNHVYTQTQLHVILNLHVTDTIYIYIYYHITSMKNYC